MKARETHPAACALSGWGRLDGDHVWLGIGRLEESVRTHCERVGA
ncbi:hypothetical protein [Rhodococcus triatomae]|nr:hypothetical protein [Rhodococcus triatomae]